VSVEVDRGALALAEKLLNLLGEGSFTATYKYAVILGLMDLCLEYSSRAGAAPTSVTTRQLAEKVLELYWPHTLPFRGGSILRQNAGGQASILKRIGSFREHYAPDAGVTLRTARLAASKPLERLVRQIEWTLVEMPLPKLQRIGSELHVFLYQINWDDHVKRSDFNSSDFDNLIRFVGDAGDHLVRLVGLVRPLVQREWADRVARLNREFVETPELEDFLFGADRVNLEPIRRDLREIQCGRCFYCDGAIDGRSEVDHFIPWARYPDNGIENLVLAHSGCNNAKRDHLAAADHVARWGERAESDRSDLAAIAEHHAWERHPDRTLSVARSIYLRLPEDALLWRVSKEFVPVDRSLLLEAFGA